MKSTGIIMQGFSIGGLLKEYRRSIAVKHAAPGVALPDEMSKGLGCKTETRRMRGLDEVNKEPDRWVLSGLYPQGTADGRL